MVRAEHRRPLSPLQQLLLEKKKPADEKGGDEGSEIPAKPAEAAGEASKPAEDPFNPTLVDGALQLEKVSGGLVLI